MKQILKKLATYFSPINMKLLYRFVTNKLLDINQMLTNLIRMLFVIDYLFIQKLIY
jgi:hypothetical protein